VRLVGELHLHVLLHGAPARHEAASLDLLEAKICDNNGIKIFPVQMKESHSLSHISSFLASCSGLA
jgi:hypothetical protein